VYGSQYFRKGLRRTTMEKSPAERSVSPAFPDDESIRPALQTALFASDPDETFEAPATLPDYLKRSEECDPNRTAATEPPDTGVSYGLADPSAAGQGSADPYDSKFLPEVLRLQPSELPDDLRDRIYNFCRTTTVANLRKMAKAVCAPTQGAKAALATSVFAEAWKRIRAVSEGDRIAEWLRCCPCGDGSSYRDWLESPRLQTMTWWRAPSDELLVHHNPARLKQSTSTTRDANESEDGPLSVNEFARLACILTQHEEARRALLDSQLNLTRAQLDRSERRDVFWTLQIAPLFNSPGTLVSFKSPVDLPDVSASLPPLTLRSGSRLMRSWAGTRSLFTVCFTNWSASGQNDPANFISFLPPAAGGGEHITSESRRALVLFHVLGCGTAHENTEVLDCVRRTSKAPYDDMEREVCVGQKDKYNGASYASARKRRRDDDELANNAFLDGAKRLADAISGTQSSPSPSLGSEVGSASILETSKLIEEYSRLLVLIEKAEDDGADDDYVQILRTQLKLSKDRIKMSQKREEERNISGRW
jgi:hypothetical protein